MFPFPFSFFGAVAEPPELELIDNNFAMEFDSGSSQYVDAGNPAELQFNNSFTISCWARVNNTGNNAIISKDSTNSIGGGYHIDFRGGNAVHAWAYNANNKLIKTSLSINTWYHIVFIFESTGGSNGNQSLYINAGTPVTNSITSFNASTVKNLRIGASEVLSGYDFGGDIDEVAIWNKALEATDVQTIYNATNDNPGKTANLWSAGLNTGLVYWNRMGD